MITAVPDTGWVFQISVDVSVLMILLETAYSLYELDLALQYSIHHSKSLLW